MQRFQCKSTRLSPTDRRDIQVTAMASVKVDWDRLVRYVSAGDNQIHYGEPMVEASQIDQIAELAKDGKLQVKVLEGSEPMTVRRTDKTDTVKRLLGPIEPRNTPIMRCIGLNYKSHSTTEFYRF